jgi:tetratricopeptide (TPR) repeat protein
MNVGILEAKLGNISQSLQFLNKAKNLAPNDYRIHLNIGNVLFKDQNFKAAIVSYKEALKFKEKDVKILKPYIISLSKLEEWQEVEEKCKLIISIDKTNPLALALLSRAMKESEKFNDLENILNKLNKKLENFEKKSKDYSRQEISKTVHKLKKKIRVKLKEIKKSKMYTSSYDNTYSTATDGIKMVEKQMENIDTGILIRSSLMNNGKTRKETDKVLTNILERDPKDLLEILKTDKTHREAMFGLGLIYYKRQEYKLSEENFLKLQNLDNKYKARSVNEKLGDIQYKFYKNSEKALKYYNAATENETSTFLLIKIGRCYERMKDFESAQKQYKKSVEINSTFLWGLFHLGCVYSKQGKETEALLFLKKAYEIDMDSTDVIARYSDELIKSSNPDDIEYAIEILKKAKANYLGNVEILFGLGKAYDKKGLIKDSIAVLEEANTYSEFYSNPNKLFLLGVLYEKEKNFNKASQIYKNILALNKEHTLALVHLGYILQHAREYKRAHKYFKYALKIDSNLSFAHFGIGKIYQIMKNYEESMKHYEKCIESDKNNFKAYFQIGVIYLDMGHYAKAQEMLEKCLELNSEYILGVVGLGDVFYETGDFVNAEKYHLKAYQMGEKDDIHVIVSYANTLAALHKYDDAIILYQTALKLDPDIGDVHYFIANIYYLNDQFEEAISHYVRSIKIDKEPKPDAYFNLANSLCTRYRYKEAIKCFKMAIKLEQNNIEAYYNLGNAYHIIGSYKKAANNYEECLKRKFCISEVRIALARNYFLMGGMDSLSRCEEILKMIVQDEPSNVNALMYLGNLKEKMGHPDEAIIYYNKINEIDPKNFEAKLNLRNLGVNI